MFITACILTSSPFQDQELAHKIHHQTPSYYIPSPRDHYLKQTRIITSYHAREIPNLTLLNTIN